MDPKYKDFQLDQPNFIEFCRYFRVVKGELKNQNRPENIVVICYPNSRYALPNTIQRFVEAT